MKIILPKNKETKNNPVNYFFVVDLSGSMYSSVRDLKDTLLSLKTLLSNKDTLSLAYFSSYGDFDWIVKGASLNNNSLDKIIQEKVYARGLTCYTQVLDSLKKTIEDVSLLTSNDNSVLYFLSDGWPNDNSPESQIYKTCESLKGKFVNSNIVGFSNYYNRPCLLSMADKMGGQFSHVDSYKGIKKSCEAVVNSKPSKTNVKIDKKYDIVWQVADDVYVLEQNKNNSVDAFAGDGDSSLFAVDFSELEDLKEKDAKFVYSLALVLSQKNKANLGISVLRKAGAQSAAKSLQKAFTVAQKGNAENELKRLAIETSGNIKKEAEAPSLTLENFLGDIKKNVGKYSINLKDSDFSSISRGGNDASKVKFETTDDAAKIVGITGNEDRANVSFLTVRQGQISEINDADLAAKVKEFNKTAKKKIKLPIEASTFRNYTLVANGDFNFEKLSLYKGNATKVVVPEKEIDLFDENVKSIKIQDFVNLYKTLIQEKAHAAVLRFYVKKYAEQKHLEDLRVTEYGLDAVPLLEEMGLDYQLRYAPKREYKPKDETGDYIPFTEISAYLSGASKISASESFKKFEKKGSKMNPADAIMWPLFENYEKMFKSIGQTAFVEYCQSTLEGLESTIDRLSQKISLMKFYLIITNSWFDGVNKEDEFEHDGLTIKVKEVKEYL